ncbi:MAG: M15 family metallopeptidase [Bacteroidales bacterium]|nr:M15 family metallopeptidase [Bacteroidales bacterium]
MTAKTTHYQSFTSRSTNIGGYRYFFNGQEGDNEVFGEVANFGYEFRQYDSRLGRWWSVDPKWSEYPGISTYAFCNGSPVMLVDPNGKEIGDYYDNKGVYLGTDGIEDGKVYQLKAGWKPNYANTTVKWGGTLEEKHYIQLQEKSNYLGLVQDVFRTGDNATDKRLQGLHPAIRMLARDFIIEANESYSGDFIRISQGYRTFQEQDNLYAQGRTLGGNVVTNAKGGQSTHNFGLAFDIVGIKDGKLDYNLDWSFISTLAKDKGFEWGGDWTGFEDKPHFENTFGHSLKTLQNLPKNKTGLPNLVQ